MIVNYLLCSLGIWMLLSIVYHVYDNTRVNWVANLCEDIIILPWKIIYNILLYIFYPIACIWLFFRNAVKGVSKLAWENTKLKLWRVWKFGCFRLCYDHHAYRWHNKFFLVRIVEPAEKISRTL